MPTGGAALALPGLGTVDTPGQRFVLMIGGGAVVMAVVVGLLFLLSLFV
jgi:hypothetical protein